MLHYFTKAHQLPGGLNPGKPGQQAIFLTFRVLKVLFSHVFNHVFQNIFQGGWFHLKIISLMCSPFYESSFGNC
jgi:hypothetical protein